MAKELVEDDRLSPELCTKPSRESPVLPVERKGNIRRRLVDTDAGIHVVGRQHLTSQQLKARQKADAVSLNIANGVTECDEIVELMVDELGLTVWA